MVKHHVKMWIINTSQNLRSRLLSLMMPNIEFDYLRVLGCVGCVWVLWRKEEPVFCLVYVLLLSVNLVFVPQHRQRWIMDLLFIIWNAIVVYDVMKYMETRLMRIDRG